MLLGLLMTAPALARELSAPATQPAQVQTESIARLLDDLESADPSLRESARDQLLLLDASQLSSLRDTIARLDSISLGQVLALKEIVVHVHTTGEHHFSGEGRPLIGITRSSFDGMETSCVVGSRRIGFDAYRVLRDGDQIVQLALVDPRDGTTSNSIAVKLFSQMQTWVRTKTRPRNWIELIVIRSGERLNLRLRIAPNPDPTDGTAPNYTAWLNNAIDYWNREFEPMIRQRSRRV